MGRPRLIIVIRHAQSEGNKNREIHQSIPDHRVKLTTLGWQQARDAGRRLRALLRPDDTLQFFTSPYRRTRETADGILESLTGPDPDSAAPSPFPRDQIKVYEEPRLREQDFGNFQPCSAEMERMWQERADYGHFFYRIPNGESAADAYDRISGFNESLWRQFGDDDFPSVCVLVTHGLMSRVFLMKWYHFTVEYFEDLRNVNHCEFLIMRKQDDTGKYLLENKLRTWSELRRERAERDKEKEKEKDGPKLERTKTFVVTRRWGGCPNGCNHSAHYKRRDDLEVLRQRDLSAANCANGIGSNNNSAAQSGHSSPLVGSGAFAAPSPSTIASRRMQQRHHHQQQQHQQQQQQQQQQQPQQSQTSYISDDDYYIGDGQPVSDGPDGVDADTATAVATAIASPSASTPIPQVVGPKIDVDRALEELVSSPDGTPSFIPPEHRVAVKSPHFFRGGRDGGGSCSGVQSLANSDAEEQSDDDLKMRHRHRHGGGGGGGGGASQGGGSLHVTGGGGSLGSISSFKMRNMAEALGLADDTAAPAIERSGGSGGSSSTRANKLGDGASASSDAGSEGDGGPVGGEAKDDDLGRIEREEKSVMSSVY